MKLASAALSIFFITGNVYAACWTQVGETNNAIVSVNACAIEKEGIYSKTWVKFDYSATLNTPDYPPKKYNKTIGLYYFNCSSRKLAPTQGIYYSEDGEVVKTESISIKNVIFNEAAPDTIGETQLNFICAKHKRSP